MNLRSDSTSETSGRTRDKYQKNILNGKYKELVDELVLAEVIINSWLLSPSIVSRNHNF